MRVFTKTVSFLFAGFFFTKVFQAGGVEDDWEQSPPNIHTAGDNLLKVYFENITSRISPAKVCELLFTFTGFDKKVMLILVN